MIPKNYLKVENEKYLYKNPSTGTIINSDVSGREAYRKLKKQYELAEMYKTTTEKDLSKLKNEIDEIKDDIKEIKYLLNRLVK